jgi:hypothetical protein
VRLAEAHIKADALICLARCWHREPCTTEAHSQPNRPDGYHYFARARVILLPARDRAGPGTVRPGQDGSSLISSLTVLTCE